MSQQDLLHEVRIRNLAKSGTKQELRDRIWAWGQNKDKATVVQQNYIRVIAGRTGLHFVESELEFKSLATQFLDGAERVEREQLAHGQQALEQLHQRQRERARAA